MNGATAGSKVWIFLCLLVFLAGCATSEKAAVQVPEPYAAPRAAAPNGGSDDAPAMTERPSPSPVSASAPPAPSPRSASEPQVQSTSSSRGSSSAGAERSQQAPKKSADAAPSPTTRPGLGTEFGEARSSRIHEVGFVREAGRPFAIASLNYNDRRGVDALAASARRDSSRSVSTAGGAVTISVRDANGNPLEAVRAGERTFVVGQAGQRYTIVLENHTGHRFEAVGTVDGLDVINGKPGTFENRGYVLLPFATLEIEGFRTSSAEVAAFRFAAVADSYAAQTGSARNVGVIGLAFFSERGDAFVPESEVRLRESASPFPADPRFAQPPSRR